MNAKKHHKKSADSSLAQSSQASYLTAQSSDSSISQASEMSAIPPILAFHSTSRHSVVMENAPLLVPLNSTECTTIDKIDETSNKSKYIFRRQTYPL